MKKTFITSMPDQAGAFLAAGRIIAAAGGNITRVSYNKAVDTHMLFLDVSGDEAQKLCEVQVIEYDENERVLDTVFCMRFVDHLVFSPAEYRYCPGHGAIMELK